MSSATKPTQPFSAVAGATTALVLLTALNFVNYIDRYILPGVQEQVKREFAVSDAQIGALVFWFMIAYMATSPFTGWLGDRFPRKPMIVVTALLMSACNFFTSSVQSYGSLNLRHAALGVGEASFGIFAPAMLADFYAESQRNRVLTIFNVAIPIGAAIGVTAGGAIGEHYGWRHAFVLSAIPGAILAVLIAIFLREPARVESAHEKAAVNKGVVMSLLRNKAYMFAILGYAAVTFSLGGISNWMASFLQRVTGYSQTEATGVMGPIIVVGGLGGTVVGGWWAQRWSKKNPRAMYYVPGIGAALTVAPAMLCFFGPKSLTLPSLAVAVFLIFLGTGPVNASTLNSVPQEMRASAMAGQLLVIHLLGDMSSPNIIGIISDHSNLRIGLGSTLVTMLIATVIFFMGAKYAPKLHSTLDEAEPIAAV
jgi:MFS transporter, Spinster family, sphingosine-1-phosphate transporter